jgi:competence protein ComEA
VGGAIDTPALRRDPHCHALVLAALAAAGIGIRLLLLSPPTSPLEIQNKVNPNTVGLPALLALPGIGPAKARAIVDFRRRQAGPGPVFVGPSDLTAVPGIGPVTVQRMAPYLCFEAFPVTQAREKVLDRTADSIIMPLK